MIKGVDIMKEKKVNIWKVVFISATVAAAVAAIAVAAYMLFKKYFKITFECDDDCDNCLGGCFDGFDDDDFIPECGCDDDEILTEDDLADAE